MKKALWKTQKSEPTHTLSDEEKQEMSDFATRIFAKKNQTQNSEDSKGKEKVTEPTSETDDASEIDDIVKQENNERNLSQTLMPGELEKLEQTDDQQEQKPDKGKEKIKDSEKDESEKPREMSSSLALNPIITAPTSSNSNPTNTTLSLQDLQKTSSTPNATLKQKQLKKRDGKKYYVIKLSTPYPLQRNTTQHGRTLYSYSQKDRDQFVKSLVEAQLKLHNISPPKNSFVSTKRTEDKSAIEKIYIYESDTFREDMFLHKYVNNNNITAIYQGIRRENIDISAQTESGDTALHRAVRKNNPILVDLILLGGINKDIKNDEGQTALDIALNNSNINSQILTLLDPYRTIEQTDKSMFGLWKTTTQHKVYTPIFSPFIQYALRRMDPSTVIWAVKRNPMLAFDVKYQVNEAQSLTLTDLAKKPGYAELNDIIRKQSSRILTDSWNDAEEEEEALIKNILPYQQTSVTDSFNNIIGTILRHEKPSDKLLEYCRFNKNILTGNNTASDTKIINDQNLLHVAIDNYLSLLTPSNQKEILKKRNKDNELDDVIRYAMMYYLLRHNPDVNQKNVQGQTPFVSAAVVNYDSLLGILRTHMVNHCKPQTYPQEAINALFALMQKPEETRRTRDKDTSALIIDSNIAQYIQKLGTESQSIINPNPYVLQAIHNFETQGSSEVHISL